MSPSGTVKGHQFKGPRTMDYDSRDHQLRLRPKEFETASNVSCLPLRHGLVDMSDQEALSKQEWISERGASFNHFLVSHSVYLRAMEKFCGSVISYVSAALSRKD